MSKPVLTISLSEARAIALRAQGLAEKEAPFGWGKEGVLNTIEQLGYVQVDTISVLQRAHHHVLWSRVPDYRPGMLHDLQSPERQVFEYWAHAASYLLMRDYRFSLPMMKRFRTEWHWAGESPEMLKAMRRLRRMIQRDGALKISDVEGSAVIRSWGEETMGKIERRALHEMWMAGEILISSRAGFEKVFDLPERVLPPQVETKMPPKREAAEFHARQALRALGVAHLADLAYLRGGDHKAALAQAIQRLVRAGEVVELRLEGEAKKPLFALPAALATSQAVARDSVRFLSPFDNLVIQRKRLRQLFGFDYTVEIYVPAAKRKYGYFVLPILWGDRLVARMDAKAFRAERKLVIHYLAFEPDFREWHGFAEPFAAALRDFATFQGCDTWQFGRVEPSGFQLPAAS